MELFRGMMQFIEDHPALFSGLGAIAVGGAAIGGMLLQYFRNKRERDQRLSELKTSHERENSLASRIGGLETSLNHREDEAIHLHERVVDLNQRVELERIQREVDVAHQKETRAEREKAMRAEVQKREGKLIAVIHSDRDELAKHEKQRKRWENVLRRTLKAEGEFFASKTRCGTPKFRPLQDRRTAIVSVLNLKGGVGKTTVTAHLGAAFAAKGYRVLLVDLDLQGSLSSIFLAQSEIHKRAEEKKLLQHYLGLVAQGRKPSGERRPTPKLKPYIQPILPGTKSGIIATSDQLSFSEINLTLTWQLRLGSKKDSRFFLRKALHLKQVLNHYDIILLDCPPLINSCCTNALAASDYVLIPATLSQNSLDRIPKLIRTIKKFNNQVNPHLQILGTVANRTWGSQFTESEETLWNMMLNQAKDQLGSPLHAFETLIRNSKEVRESEDVEDAAFAPPIPGSLLFDTFRKLATEVEERLPLECRRAPAASEQLESLAS